MQTTDRKPKFAHAGRQRRFSFIARDKSGKTVRGWHVDADGMATRTIDSTRAVAPEIAKSLIGMVQP